MPPYDLINTSYEILAIGIGVGITVLVILARGSTFFSWSFRKRSDAEIEEHLIEFGGGVSERNAPVPIAIWLVAAAVTIWSVGYILSNGATGP
jgi:hypothetical protein